MRGSEGCDRNYALCGKFDIENPCESATYVRREMVDMLKKEPVLVAEEVI